jgi:pimeloyl-ACP methyl ester carboxylesterase
VRSSDQEIEMEKKRIGFTPLLLAALVMMVVSANPAIAEDKFFNSNGVKIRYVEQGTGEPIVLVHGYTENLDSWFENGVFQNLAASYHVIALDVRGMGKSGKPHDPKFYGTEESEDIVRLLDHLHVRRAHIVGYSMGSMIVARLLTMHPDRFLTATLGGSAGRNVKYEPDERTLETEAAEAERGNFGTIARRVRSTDAPPPSDEAMKQMSQRVIDRGNDPIALAAHVRARHNLVVNDAQMAAIRVPTLAVVGSLDPNLQKLRDLKTVLPSLKIVVVQGAGHPEVPRRPEFVNAIRGFIAAHQTATSP